MSFTKSHLPRPHCSPWSLGRGAELLGQAESMIPGLTLSMMKRPEHFSPGQFPNYLARGEGALVEDVDGNEYVDFICGLGANSLGHRHPELLGAIQAALEQGLLHSLPHELEVIAAEALISIVPGAEMARFFKTGAEATSAAIRLARAMTNRDRIATIGYNGWHDHFMFDTPGVPSSVAKLSTRLPLFAPENEEECLSWLERNRGETAAVILSVPYNRELDREFLCCLRESCTRLGVLLIFDEIVTGLRLALGGVQEFYGVDPDFSCYSKALAGGMPLSAVIGPRKFLGEMDRLQVSTTFGGELLSLAAAHCCITEFKEQGLIVQQAELGRRLRKGIREIAEQVGSTLCVVGYDAIPFFRFDPAPQKHVEMMKIFQGLMAERGVLLRRDVNFISGAHTAEQIDFAVNAARESLLIMKGQR